MTTSTQKYNFHVHGMHCNSCVLLIENELGSLPNILEVKSNLKDHSLEVIGNFGDKEIEKIAEELTLPLKAHGYRVALDKKHHDAKWGEFKMAIPIALGFVFVFYLLQKLGIINIVNSENVTYGTAFLIGIIASLSTCMAVVGGLLLSMSATFAKEGDKVKPQILFHLGRLISFFILGGVIGTIGSAFTLNTNLTFILGLLIGLVMLILGINLLDVFPWAKKIQPSMPKFISKKAHSISNLNHTITPFLVGVATFFLPCGFTQSMQLYTLTTDGFMEGAMTMFIFALGTLPVLALISFSSFGIKKSEKSGVFFKTAGIVVILFAAFNLINSLVVIGLLPAVFNF